MIQDYLFQRNDCEYHLLSCVMYSLQCH